MEEFKKTKRRDKFMAREAGIRQQIKSSFIPKDGKRKVRRKKPAWAHTEESKQEEDEVLAEEELDQLIKFTENLDFDKYLDTEEVKEAMALAEQTEDYVQAERDALTDESMVHPDSGEPEDDPKVAIVRWKWRMRMLEKVDPVTGEISEGDEAIIRRDYLLSEGVDVLPIPMDRLSLSRGLQASGAAVMGLSEDALQEWNQKFKSSLENNQKDDDAMSDYAAAKSALSGTKLGAVHSTNSISAIKKQLSKVSEKPEVSALDQVYQEPTVSVIQENRLKYQKAVNKLPYMNRNPAM